MSPPALKLSTSSLLLVLAGSATDAIMILAFNVLTAAQTGNTILFAVAVAKGDLVTGLSSAISIATFLAGAIVGSRFCHQARPIVALILQMALLSIALGLWLAGGKAEPGAFSANILVALAAASMGLQSAVTIHLHGQPGTYITGLLTNFAVSLGATKLSSSLPVSAQGLVWLLYLAGAIVSGLLFLAFGPLALLVPIAALAGSSVHLARHGQSNLPDS
ncbi:MAG: hypothetical protein Fur0032_24250 [Terrimicrobiaceae bacterium]